MKRKILVFLIVWAVSFLIALFMQSSILAVAFGVLAGQITAIIFMEEIFNIVVKHLEG